MSQGPYRVSRGPCKHDHPDTSADVVDAAGDFVADCGCSPSAAGTAQSIVEALNGRDSMKAENRLLRVKLRNIFEATKGLVISDTGPGGLKPGNRFFIALLAIDANDIIP